MAEFVLDTSGVVWIDEGAYAGDWTWRSLPGDFVRGCLEALFAEAQRNIFDKLLTPGEVAFFDLSPAALELILKDCEAQASVYGDRKPDRTDGGIFWSNRQGWRLPTFPPLRLVLSDEGKVDLREAARG